MTRRQIMSCQDGVAAPPSNNETTKDKPMKTITKLVSAFGIASAIAVTTALGQFNTVVVDEHGNGLYNGVPITGAPLIDPITGSLGLAYTLPFIYGTAAWPFPAADIELYEPSTSGNLIPSDLLRFTRDPNGPNTLLFFYSDSGPLDPPDSLADQFGGLPPAVYPYTSGLEIGLPVPNPYTEAGPNGFVYTTLGGIGWDGTPGVATEYTFISDGVIPEPSSLALLVCGLGTWGLGLRRRTLLGA
jgi:hypothetical protein